MQHIPFKEIAALCRVAFQNWISDRAPRMGAALAYYIALSLAPTVLILVAIAGFAFGTQAAQGRLVSQIQGFVGYEGAKAIQTMIEGAHQSSRGIAATVLGLVTVFFASSAVVSELRDAMNTIWRVPEDTTSSAARSIFNLVKDRLVSLRSRAGFRLVPGDIADCECLDFCGGNVSEFGLRAARGSRSDHRLGGHLRCHHASVRIHI